MGLARVVAVGEVGHRVSEPDKEGHAEPHRAHQRAARLLHHLLVGALFLQLVDEHAVALEHLRTERADEVAIDMVRVDRVVDEQRRLARRLRARERLAQPGDRLVTRREPRHLLDVAPQRHDPAHALVLFGPEGGLALHFVPRVRVADRPIAEWSTSAGAGSDAAAGAAFATSSGPLP